MKIYELHSLGDNNPTKKKNFLALELILTIELALI